MGDDIGYRVALSTILVTMIAIRSRAHRQVLKSAGKSVEFESRLNITLRILAALSLMTALVAYIVNPDWMAWASMPLPAWLRWLGAPFGAAGLAGLYWVHRELGRNFSGTLHLRTEHELITSGPYRRVRHPMYTAFYLMALSFLLLSANWLIGGGTIAGLSAVMLSRVKHEEAVMTERFGDQYRAYMAQSGRFLPPFRG